MGYLAKYVLTQKNRIGGDFVVAQAVFSQDMRDHIRTILPDCIFITLSVTQETQEKRIKERHGDSDSAEGILGALKKMYKLYEGPGIGEKNTYNVDITEEMSPKDVLDKVIEILEKNCQ